MHRTPRRLTPLLLLLPIAAAAAPLAAQDHQHHGGGGVVDTSSGLGTVVFPNSGAAAAQGPFLRGLALLHSFEYADAADAFREARRRDPGFALAHWMEALTYRQGVWGMEELADARGVLAKLAPTAAARLARARQPRERSFGAAVEALFADAPERDRVNAFADSLRRLAAADPADPEWATFAAVAIMDAFRWMAPAERARARDESAALAERAFASHPTHPGAAHFVIHANDDPVHAPRAEAAARAYARIAPAADHALHMPSHIFVQLGAWDDAVASNERSWVASRAWAAKRGGPAAQNVSWHTLVWLEYGYLQQGRRRAARALLDTARAILGPRGDTIPGIDVRFALGEMEFLYGANTGDWPPPGPVARTPGQSMRAFGFASRAPYMRAVAAHMRGDRGAAAAASARFRSMADSMAGRPGAGSLRLFADQLDALAAGTARLRAVAATDTVPPLGPPLRMLSAELLGDALLKEGDGAGAAAAYEHALRMAPRRSTALLGLARARAKAGDRAGSARAYRELLAGWRNADPDLPELAEAREGAKAAN